MPSPATWALRSAISTARGSYHHRVMADRRKVRAILDRLRREYGRPVLRPHRAPIDELILTVLSQNTNDRNRDVAYGRLRERFDSWAAVREAPVADVEDARRYLCRLPGVGRKTAACVLLFSYGRHDVPVDTHVYRVGTRLGLFRPRAPLEEAHDEML